MGSQRQAKNVFSEENVARLAEARGLELSETERSVAAALLQKLHDDLDGIGDAAPGDGTPLDLFGGRG